MKKKLLFVAVLTASMLASAQAPSPYPYYSFKKNDAVAPVPTYSVPDAAIASASSLDAVAVSLNTQGLGLQCVNFDQATTDVSSYSGDYLKTCGPTPSAFAETALVTAIRSWVTNDAGFVAGTTYSSQKEPWLGLNANPSTFRFSGGWYYYTVNFTEAAEYEFFLRLRSGNMRALGKTDGIVTQDVDKIITVQLYNKSDMANPLKTWTLNYGGINVGALVAGTNSPTSSESTNGSVKFFSWAKGTAGTPFLPTAGQAASFWSKAAQTYTIPAAGEYVVKISDNTLKFENQTTTPGAGDSNNAIGSFTFIKKTVTGLNEAVQVNAYATVSGKNISVSSNVSKVEVYSLVGDIVMSKNVDNKRFEIANTGVYLLKMITAEGSKVQKIVVR